MSAPSAAAESAVSSTRRASSVRQSQYWPAPQSPSRRSAGSALATAFGLSMRREALQALALAHRLEHQAYVPLLQVAEPAVNQLGRPARRAGGEVTALDERHPESAHGRVARDAGAVDAAAHHENVERLAAERGERVTSPGLGLAHSEWNSIPGARPLSRRVNRTGRSSSHERDQPVAHRAGRGRAAEIARPVPPLAEEPRDGA